MSIDMTPPHAAPQLSFDDVTLTEYCNAVQRAFLAAWQDVSSRSQQDYGVGGHVVRLRSPDRRVLDKMGAALAHLRIAPQPDPELVISLWDSAGSIFSRPPPSPWRWYAESRADGRVPVLRFNSHGELTDFRSERIYTAFRLRPNKLRVLDIDRNRAFYWTEDVDHIPDYEYCAPLRKILAWWMGTRGQQIAHTAAVGTDDGGVLLAGRGGVGKSTTALACLGSPLRFAGDDCCLLDGRTTPAVASLYSSAKLKTSLDMARFPALAQTVHNQGRRDDEKAFMFLDQHRPQHLTAGFPVRALLVPAVTETPRPRLVPISPIAGLAALAPSTLRLFPGLEREANGRLSEFVSKVPSYRLEVGPNLSLIPRAILHCLERT